MARFDSIPRVGRSQGVVIFWGLVSAFFAAAACLYFLKNAENEKSARELRDEVLVLQEQRETLSSQKMELQASISETQKQLDTRAEFLQEKETKLAAEESRLESLGVQTENQTEQIQSQASVIRKFDDTVRKLSKGNDDYDVVVRGGRPVLRAPGGVFFALGDATLKPEGKAVLNQIAQALNNQLDTFELRVETFTDGDSEIQLATDEKPDPNAKPAQKPAKPTEAAGKLKYATSWDLTAARAIAIERYLRDQTSLPFQNVLVVARADFQPIVAIGKDGHAKNRRVEITITPLPAPFHALDTTHVSSSAGAGKDKAADAAPNPLEPPPDPPVGKDGGN